MGLNKTSGNMYDFITHTWNPIKGQCSHGCSYCYMVKLRKRFNQKEKAAHLDEKELKTNLGEGNYIFAGSSCDIFTRSIRAEWILKVLDHAKLFENKYLFQTKNPYKAVIVIGNFNFPMKSVLSTTLETNRDYQDFYDYVECPLPWKRAKDLSIWHGEKMITIEPIMDFDTVPFLEMIKKCEPSQVNIGAGTGNNHLPEPPEEKVIDLISELMKFTQVVCKPNLKRIIEPSNLKKSAAQ
jgi:hypothetical protein